MAEDLRHKPDTWWRERLSPEEFEVLRQRGTEPPFTGRYYRSRETGIYHCAACDLPLFQSETKYESGTGWPSFWEPIDPENIETRNDEDFRMTRTEVICHGCGSHLGHVFDDGPPPSRLRYCINSVALKLEKESDL